MIKSQILIDIQAVLRDKTKLKDPITLESWLKRAEEYIRKLETKEIPRLQEELNTANQKLGTIEQEEKENKFEKTIKEKIKEAEGAEESKKNYLRMVLEGFLLWETRGEESQKQAVQNLKTNILTALDKLGTTKK